MKKRKSPEKWSILFADSIPLEEKRRLTGMLVDCLHVHVVGKSNDGCPDGSPVNIIKGEIPFGLVDICHFIPPMKIHSVSVDTRHDRSHSRKGGITITETAGLHLEIKLDVVDDAVNNELIFNFDKLVDASR